MSEKRNALVSFSILISIILLEGQGLAKFEKSFCNLDYDKIHTGENCDYYHTYIKLQGPDKNEPKQ